MRTVKLTIEYDGTEFNGWQTQKNVTCRTVQGELEAALTRIFKNRIIIRGAGRTDAGVHARGQVAHFTTRSPMPAAEILKALNGNLPPDIAIVTAEEVPMNFHAQIREIGKANHDTNSRGNKKRNFADSRSSACRADDIRCQGSGHQLSAH